MGKEIIPFNHIGLFEGIGGFSLAARWMGWETIATCEINDFCNNILKYHFPNAKQHYDIKQTDFTIYRGKCDILTGGFPCQPFSIAGKRKGTDDDRHLFPEMLRAIREIQPTWIVGENVFGIVNWDGGLVFEQVQADLEAEGYEVQSFILPAASVNAPHERYRVWFVAYSYTNSNNRRSCKIQRENEKKRIQKRKQIQQFSKSNNVFTPNDTSKRLQRSLPRNPKLLTESIKKRIITNSNSRRQPCKEHRKTQSGQFAKESFSNYWENFPTQSPICSGNDGISNRLDGITFPKWRNESIKAYGNAVVPQLVYQIFKAIEQYNKKYFQQ